MENRFSNIKFNDSGRGGKLIYFGDPMCSWCWGFVPHLSKLKHSFEGILDFEFVMGGLRPGGGDPWNRQMKEFLRHHWKLVNERSGQPFNYDILDSTSFNYDTEPPSRAVVVARDLVNEKAFDFFKDVQHAFYVLNKDPNEEEFYYEICLKHGIDFSVFIRLFRSDTYKEKVKLDFLRSRQTGIKGFPSLVFQHNNSFDMVTNGYSTFETMNRYVNSLLQLDIRAN